MHKTDAEKLIKMYQKDKAKREQLKAEGRLYNDQYQEDMKAIHESNADELAAMISKKSWNWPSPDTDGREVCGAAFMIVQHAVSKREFQKSCLNQMKKSITEGRGDPIAAAYLEDRLLMFEDKPQIYGTQHIFDSTSNRYIPYNTQDPNNVDIRRTKIGLPPLTQITAELNDERDKSL